MYPSFLLVFSFSFTMWYPLSQRFKLFKELCARYLDAPIQTQLETLRALPHRSTESKSVRRWLAWAFFVEKPDSVTSVRQVSPFHVAVIFVTRFHSIRTASNHLRQWRISLLASKILSLDLTDRRIPPATSPCTKSPWSSLSRSPIFMTIFILAIKLTRN